MLLDFDSPETPNPGHADICVIGAGAAGILLAIQLAAAGRTVTLLEGGGRDQEARSQDIYRSHVTGLPHTGIHTGRYRTYGGTTTQWGGQILELDPFDFTPRPHVPGSGWPFTKSELEPYYPRALRFEGLRRVQTDDAEVWKSLNLKAPDPGPGFSTLFSRWCPERNFAVLHGHELTHSRRLSVFTHANVTALNLNPGRSAMQSVTIRGFSGREATVTAGAFILAMGAIETTRLLLQPMSDGIAPWQSNGILGRFYQDHIGVNGIEITSIAAQPAWEYFGYVTTHGYRYHNKIRLDLDQQIAHNTLNVAGTIGPFRTERPNLDRANVTIRKSVRERCIPSTSDAINAALHLPEIASGLISRRLRGDAPEWKRTMLTVHAEQSPLSNSIITLSAERDELGLLRTRLDWQVSAEELHTIRTYVRLATDSFARTGFARVEPPAGFYTDDALLRSMCSDSNHHMGSTRMSTAPSAGIVDPNLRLHGLTNAYVCSASIFTSSGFSNPTHTVLALATRLADRLSGTPKSATSTGNSVLSATPPPLREVPLPGTAKTTPQLAFGCAYLLGPGLDWTTSRRLLDAAWDAGVRHFDVARLYGQGQTEALLGDFLRHHPTATVTTKYGIVPPTTPERAVLAIQRRFPPIKKLYRRNGKARFRGADAAASLDLSLRLLRRDYVDVFLLHEPTVHDLVHEDLLSFLESAQQTGKIGAFGIGGEFGRMEQLFRERPAYAPVLQFESSIFGPFLNLPETRGPSCIYYRTFARAAKSLSRRFDRDPRLGVRWSSVIGVDIAEPLVLSRLLLKAALDQNPANLMLFSTRSEEHIFENVTVASDTTLEGPAKRLFELTRAEELDITAELYGLPGST
jgi:choline dehydrogenase-like flavoprotein/aryl-alcohol dehydrogenase-like predicted oxidoreductase